MSRHINRATLLGVIASVAPTLVASSGQGAVCKFTLGTFESYKSKGVVKRQEDWHTVIVLGKQAEALFPLLAPGKRLYVEGRLVNRSRLVHGVTVVQNEVRASQVILLGHDADLDKLAEADE